MKKGDSKEYFVFNYPHYLFSEIKLTTIMADISRKLKVCLLKTKFNGIFDDDVIGHLIVFV